MPMQELTLAQRLRRHWPQNLGTMDEEGISWTFLTEAGMRLGLWWYSYNDKGYLSVGENVVCLYCVICIQGLSKRFSGGPFDAGRQEEFHPRPKPGWRLYVSPSSRRPNLRSEFRGLSTYTLFRRIIPDAPSTESTGSRLPLSAVAYTLLQLIHNQPRGEELSKFHATVSRTTEKFLVSYLSKWSIGSTRQSVYGFHQIMHTHSIRYYKITFFPPTKFLLSLDSILVSRETGALPTQKHIYMRDGYHWLCLANIGIIFLALQFFISRTTNVTFTTRFVLFRVTLRACICSSTSLFVLLTCRANPGRWS
jgi:hypothetical protein